jgi:hypothetical protein
MLTILFFPRFSQSENSGNKILVAFIQASYPQPQTGNNTARLIKNNPFVTYSQSGQMLFLSYRTIQTS